MSYSNNSVQPKSTSKPGKLPKNVSGSPPNESRLSQPKLNSYNVLLRSRQPLYSANAPPVKRDADLRSLRAKLRLTDAWQPSKRWLV